ncbi:hypothetical protein BACPEC_00294 [[Bacteroides] pectinophilus ATCC 43243]|uniref:Uncharacterized protein n=1 Tax=[Bacteroides] pectinophilus ATCC 43243 TaxID=483218 RepID=B7ANP0_9FIRM|nr:hypothetical protein BACPEC_00294 [[Bacteroides] pectinophilus ATCC 43243]
MNNRLNKIYEEIYDIEDRITDSEKKKEAAQQDVLTKENVFKMLLVFDKIFDKMNDVDKRKLIESMIAEVHLHPKETWEEGKNPIKEIKYAFPVSKEVMDALRENVASVETVILLSQKAPDAEIKVRLDMSELDITSAENKATYKEIQEYVKNKYDLHVTNLYIAQVKREFGIIERENYNTGEGKAKVPQVTAEKKGSYYRCT